MLRVHESVLLRVRLPEQGLEAPQESVLFERGEKERMMCISLSLTGLLPGLDSERGVQSLRGGFEVAHLVQ